MLFSYHIPHQVGNGNIVKERRALGWVEIDVFTQLMRQDQQNCSLQNMDSN